MKRYMKKKVLQEYCCGCGLCSSLCGASFHYENGFLCPQINEEDTEVLNHICPSATSGMKTGTVAPEGPYLDVYLGWAKDSTIREMASSGGVLSALAIQMLELKLVNGVLHVGADLEKPWRTKVYCSRTKEDVLSHAGSRYAQSLTLSEINKYLDTGEKYLLIGKPCDIRAMRNYARLNSLVNQSIPYMFSFFCMGTPSEEANLQLLDALECQPNACKSLQYRGNGWPGSTEAISISGASSQMTYNASWGKILGRDLRKYCKFCMEGFGDSADISCGDAWYLNPNNEPDFSEREGRNVIFVRTNAGQSVMNTLRANEFLEVTDFSNELHSLRYMQKSQYARKELMLFRQLAMMLMFKSGPRYNICMLKSLSQKVSIAKGLDTILGSVSRIIKGKL